MSGFSVEVPAVDALSFRIATAASDARAAQAPVDAQGCVDTGYADLTGALSSYAAFWSQFGAGAAAQVDATAASVASAAAAYQSVDSTVMASPALTGSFVQATLSGNDGLATLLVGPLLGSPAPVAPVGGLPGLPGSGG